MSNVTITQLPYAGTITGTESVPIVQNGQTVQTTTGAIAASPSQTQTFLTLNQEPTLANSRALSTGTGLGLVDGGAQSTLQIRLNGTAASLESATNGVIVKTGSNTIAARTIQTTGNGIQIADGNGIAGNPNISLTGLVQSLANSSGAGLLAMPNNGTVTPRAIDGTADQISVTNGNGAAGNPTVRLADNAILPGTGSMTVPSGTTAQQPAGSGGQIRYDSTVDAYLGYASGSWRQFSLAGGVTLINTGTGLTGGPITSTGTISIANTAVTAGTYGSSTQVGQFAVNAQGQLTSAANVTITPSGIGAVASVSGTAGEITATGTTNVVLSLPTALTFTGKTVTDGTFNMAVANVGSDAVTTNTASQTLTGKTMSGGSNTFSNIANSSLVNSTISGVALGSNLNALTISTGLSGSSYNGSGAVTIAIDSTVATLDGAQTLTNKSISGATNTLSSIPNSALSNSSVTFNGVAVALGASGTITAVAPNALTIGTGLTGTSYNGSAGVTVAIDSTVATLTGVQTLTNKTLTSPTVNTPALSGGTIDNAVIGSTIPAAATFTSAALTTGTVSTTPSAGTDIANKTYVDTVAAAGIHYHTPVFVESPNTAGNLNALYNQPGGAGVGVGATLTNNGTKAALVIDGVLMTTTKRVLIYNQTNAFENGVYTVTTVGTPDPGGTNWVLTRATDADTYAPSSPNSLGQGDAFFVTSGDTGAGEGYVCTTVGTITFGTTAITFSQFSASVAYSAGTGLNLSPATTFNISNTAVTAGSYGLAASVPTFSVNAQGQLTSAVNTAIAIANTQVSGLGTMSTQNAGAVAITGGTIDGTTIGATAATTGNFTTVTATSGISGGTF